MAEFHLMENEKLLLCAPQLIVEIFTAREQEFFMEIAIEKTEESRWKLGQTSKITDSWCFQEQLANASRTRVASNDKLLKTISNKEDSARDQQRMRARSK